MYDYYHYDEFLYRQNQSFIANLEKAINGEYSAIHCYEKIASLAPTDKEKKQILEIREDEINHYHHFAQLYTNLTGHSPQPKITEKCPDTYKSGLEFAIQDEQETVDFYLEIADHAPDQSTKTIFQRAAADEQNHAVWFLYYFVKNKH